MLGSPVLASQRTQVVDLAAKSRLPAIYNMADFVEAGGLMFYGVNNADLDRRAATYVDKILKGTKPADLPVEQPKKFEFIINLENRQADWPDDSTECAGAGGQSDQMIVQSKIENPASNMKTVLELVKRKPQCASAVHQPVVVAREHHGLSLLSEKIHRRQMEGIQSPYRLGKGLQRSREHRRRKLYQGQATEQRTHFVRVRSCQFPRVNPRPNLVFDEAAGNQWLLPKAFGWRSVFRQEMRQCDRSIEVNQRSLRSCSSSFCNLRKDVTGLRGGGPDAASAGGVIQPLRTASASKASASTGLLVLSGGTISATTRSRSVTRTVSPRSARRTYSLSLFFRTFNPTAFMFTNVAPGSYLCQGVGRTG